MEHTFSHISVLLHECIEALNINPDGIYVDCTLGGGGHSLEIVKRLKNGKLICIDHDAAAIEAAGKRLADYKDKIIFVKNNFSAFSEILSELGIEKIDGALLDLGVSSYQLDTPERGFSYNAEAPLDMRMNETAALSAYDVVNNYSESDLRRIISVYGEDNNASRIASAIVRARAEKPVETTTELVDIIKSVTPKKLLAVGHHPAKKTFQAIRIEVNSEISIIEPTLKSIAYHLNPNGRIAVITFHSLEDRAAKHTFASLATGCTCPPSYPVCVCGKKPIVTLVNKKPILPSEEELLNNHRSHSAKLRIVQKNDDVS
ncbi:MAG: 16S rRNA (cytosine(1402)-N(4))-methyltransferase RsmH [Clostridia bacterium]|nr:16S rRNA (cytosine(1402)-N(4))-methyltransferase RsmH [Clostridia bacterium]